MSASRPLKVFLCHASGDKLAIRKLYRQLRTAGIEPWLDEEDLVLGQDWPQEIPKAVRAADAILVCLSQKSTTKEGYAQKEIKYALDAAEEKPEGTIFIIPLKLEECAVPERLQRWQAGNLFEERGYEKLIQALQARAAQLDGVTVTPAPQTSGQLEEPSLQPPQVEEIPEPIKGEASEGRTRGKSQSEDLTPSNTPTPRSTTVEVAGESAVVALTWDYVQGAVPADRFLIFQSGGTPLTTSDSTVVVSITSRTYRVTVAREKMYRFGIAAANRSNIGPIIESFSSPEWEIEIERDRSAPQIVSLSPRFQRDDREYELLRELTEKIVELKNAADEMIGIGGGLQVGNESAEEKKSRRLKQFWIAAGDLSRTCEIRRPFYPDEIYDLIKKLQTQALGAALDYQDLPPEYYRATEISRQDSKAIRCLTQQALGAIRERVKSLESTYPR